MTLTIVGLPIGNIEDISDRALRTLQESQLIICEDTRMFNNLWSKLMSMGRVQKFEGRLKFVNDFNEYKVLPKLLQEMNSLDEAVLVSDAGMPLISDPGYKLVRGGLDLGWDVVTVPGPTAESAALAISGLPTDKYFFVGFPPKKEGKRLEMFNNLKKSADFINFTVVFYESAMRLEKIITEMVNIFGQASPACLALDMTKVSEKILRGNLSDILANIKGKNLKGEATLVVSLANN